MKKSTLDFLVAHSEREYRDFSGSLIPGEKTMLGVRLPILRKKAQEIAKADWKEELKSEDIYFEEVMLRGMIISYVKGSMDEMLPYIEAFIPCVQNWSVCDSVFMKMDVLRTDRERTWHFIQPYLQSEKKFEVRVAIIIMMQHLLKCDENGKTMQRLRRVNMTQCASENATQNVQQEVQPEGMYLERVLQALDRPYSQYYASMAAAWTVAEAFCCFPARVYQFLQQNQLDDATYNRALQKIVESLIPEPDVKEAIKSMKRKGRK